MKKIIRAAIFLAAIHLFGIFGSCCDKAPKFCYSLTGIRTVSLDNQGQFPTLPTSDTIPAKAYTLELTYLTESDVCYHGFNFSIYPAALAFKCDDAPFSLLTDVVRELKITSTANFNPSHPAGSDLSEYFVIPIPILDSVQTFAGESVPENFRLFLIEEPDSSRAHRFITTLTSVAGEVFADTTETVILSL